MLQRYGMILSTIGALWIIMQARRGELTAVRYAQGLGMGCSVPRPGRWCRCARSCCTSNPATPATANPSWACTCTHGALITFYVVILFVAVVSMLAPVGIPEAPTRAGAQRTISTLIVGLFALVVAANVIAIIFLEGFAWVPPDDPTGYNLLDQLGL